MHVSWRGLSSLVDIIIISSSFLSSVSRLLPPIFLRLAVHNLCGDPCGEDRRGHGLWEREEDLGRELFRRWKRTIMLPRRRRLRRAVGGNVDIARRRLIPETQASIIYQTSISRVGGRRLRPHIWPLSGVSILDLKQARQAFGIPKGMLVLEEVKPGTPAAHVWT